MVFDEPEFKPAGDRNIVVYLGDEMSFDLNFLVHPPRTWTPKGAVGMGGSVTCIYPGRTPGGYQLIGMSPMPIWDPDQRLSAFKESLALFRQETACALSPSIARSTITLPLRWPREQYRHPEVGFQKFSTDAYHAWIASLDPRE